MNKFTLTPKQLDLVVNKEETIEGFENWSFWSNTDDGDFDSEKGAMTDYLITALDKTTNKMYVGRGGYYHGTIGEEFNYPVTFTRKKVYNLLIFNESWADEHDVPALDCMELEDLTKWKQQPVNIDTYLGNSGDGFGEEWEGWTNNDLISRGVVKSYNVTEEFFNIFHKAGLADLSLCSVFDN